MGIFDVFSFLFFTSLFRLSFGTGISSFIFEKPTINGVVETFLLVLDILTKYTVNTYSISCVYKHDQ